MANSDDTQKKHAAQKNMTPAERAALGLDAALDDTEGDAEITVVDENLRKQAEAERAAEEEAAAAATQPQASAADIPQAVARGKLRLMLISTDASLFTEGSTVQTEHLTLATYFDELHVVVITDREDALPESVRLAPNAWVYATNSRSRLFAVYDAYRMATKQLSFASGFRADVVAAADPFEAGLAAYLVARRHDRPLQLQVAVNPFESYFVNAAPGNKWRVFAARFVIPRAQCVLVRSEYMYTVLSKRYRAVADRMLLLPPFRDLSFFKDAEPTFDLRQRYPQFKFILLVVSRLDERSQVDFAIDMCAPLLAQYPTIGLVVVGDGPEHGALKKQAASAGVPQQVVFESDTDDLVSHMKSANLLVNVANTEENDATIAAAAAAGLPVLSVTGGMADALFTDGVNAFLCPEHDMVCFQARVGEFLNNNQLRSTFSLNGRSSVFSAIEQDADAYRQAYVDTFERCLLNTFSEDEER